MKNIYLLGSLSILLVLVFSCKKEIDLKAQTPPGQLYANCILNPDSIFRVYLSYSVPITAPTNVIQDRIFNATNAVVLIKNDNMQVIDSLELAYLIQGNTSFLIFESFSGNTPLPNTTYHIEVREPFVKNSRIVRATTTTPPRPSYFPIYAQQDSPLISITGQDQTFRINLAWEDPRPQTRDFFIIETIYHNTAYSTNSFPPFISEHIRSELYSVNSDNDNQEVGKKTDKFLYIFIDDEKMPNRTNPDSIHSIIAVLSKTFDQWTEEYDQNFLSSDILINIHHVNEDLYRYYKDVEKYRINTSGTDIFAQPVPVRGNAEGGLGFLGAEFIRQVALHYK